MSTKFFNNLQDFIHMYNQASSATIQNFASVTEVAESTSNANKINNNNKNKSGKHMPIAVHIPSTSRESQDKDVVSDQNLDESGASFSPSSPQTPTTSILVNSSRKENRVLKKSVSFPDENCLVSGYMEPRKSNFRERGVDIRTMYVRYVDACKRHNVNHSTKIEKQMKGWHTNSFERQESLNLKGEKMSQAHVECLEEILKRLQFVNIDFEYSFLDDETLTSLSDMIEFYDSCVRLNLSFNQHIGLRGWQSLFKTVRRTPCLEHLNLRYTSLNERCVPILARTLRQGCALKVLHLENCSLTGKPLLLLACALKSNSTVQEIYLGENSLNPNDANHIQQLISGSASLTLIDVRNNHLQDVGAIKLFESLRSVQCNAHATLHTLVLWNNRLTGHSMNSLAGALMENSTLQTLNLGANNIHSDGIARLKDSLARNRSLLRLGLQATKINCQGAIALAECIADNPVLIRVDVRDNPEIKSAGLLALHLAMKMNTSITTLNLDKTCCSNSTLKVLKVKDYGDQFRQLYLELEEFCERNRKLYMQKMRDHDAQQPGMVPCSLVGDKNVLPVEEDISGTPMQGNDTPTLIDKDNMQQDLDPTGLGLQRQPSLTCTDTVEDAEQRMADMPPCDVDATFLKEEQEHLEPNLEAILTSGPPPGPSDPSSSVDPPYKHPANSVPPPFELHRPDRKLKIEPIISGDFKTGFIAKGPLVSDFTKNETGFPPVIQTPMNCVPLKAAAKSLPKQTKSRFKVTSVTTDDIKTDLSGSAVHRKLSDRSRSISLNEVKDVTNLIHSTQEMKPVQCCNFDQQEIDSAVKSVLSDLVTFCEYEIGEYAHTPSVSRSRMQLYADFERKFTEIRKEDQNLGGILGEKNGNLEGKSVVESDGDIRQSVEKVVRDLVKMTIVGERDSIRLALKHKRKKLDFDKQAK